MSEPATVLLTLSNLTGFFHVLERKQYGRPYCLYSKTHIDVPFELINIPNLVLLMRKSTTKLKSVHIHDDL